MKFTYTLKHTSVFILAAALLMACDPSENKETKLQTEHATETDTHHEHETAAELSLNNGAKWKADSSTYKNVTELYSIIGDANPVMLEDYQKTGKALQTGINNMINECKMQGPDHDALHHWLEPLMRENKKLSEVKTAEEGKELFGIIRKQIEIYSDYFD